MEGVWIKGNNSINAGRFLKSSVKWKERKCDRPDVTSILQTGWRGGEFKFGVRREQESGCWWNRTSVACVRQLWVCLCFFPLQPRCKKHLQHLLQEIQWSPLNTDLKCLQKIFFYISNVYSVCTRLWSLLQETVDIQNHFKIKENKHCWFCHSSASCTSFSNQTKLDYKETNSRDFDPDWKHVLQLTLTVFQPSAKGETEKTVAKNGGNVTNGGRKRGRTPPSLCEAPVMTCPNPPPPLGNVMWRV